MTLNINNNTNKELQIFNNNEESLTIHPFSTKRVEMSEPIELVIVYKKNGEKTFFQRIKNELSFSKIDLLHLSFGIKYSSYLKTRVNIANKAKCKNNEIKIEETIFEKNSILELRCFKVFSNTIDEMKFCFINKTHKFSFMILSNFALFIKYGIVGLFGFLFCISFFINIDYFNKEDSETVVFGLLASIIFLSFFIIYITLKIKIFKMIKVLGQL